MKHVVVVMLDTFAPPGVDDHAAYEFRSKNEAEGFVFRKLIEAGYLVEEAGKYRVEGASGEVDNKRDAIALAQDTFSTFEYFHILPVRSSGG